MAGQRPARRQSAGTGGRSSPVLGLIAGSRPRVLDRECGTRRRLGSRSLTVGKSIDAISGARPGARREIVEAYIKRLNNLEQLALSYPGVLKTYAIQAGRELRVIVGADKIDDQATERLSNEIAHKIQTEMTYPGQVKVTVIRETRAVSFAK